MRNHLQGQLPGICGLLGKLEGVLWIPDLAGQFDKVRVDAGNEVPVVLMIEVLKEPAEAGELLGAAEAEEGTVRCPQQHTHVRELARERIVVVAQEAEAVAFAVHRRMVAVRNEKKSSVATASFLKYASIRGKSISGSARISRISSEIWPGWCSSRHSSRLSQTFVPTS